MPIKHEAADTANTATAPAGPHRAGRALMTGAGILPWSLVGLLLWTNRPYALDLASHFLPHAGFACLLLGLVLLATRQRRIAVSILLAAASTLLLSRASVSAPLGGGGGTGRVIRIVEFNAREEFSRHDNDAFTWIRDQKADVIVLIEPPWGVLDDYPWLKRDYPYFIEPTEGLMWSIMLLSRFPAEVHPLAEYSEETKFSFAARRSMLVAPEGGSQFLLSAIHPPSPRSRETWARSLESAGLAARLLRDWHAQTRIPILIAGDFNSTPTGRLHRRFARDSGLTAWTPLATGGTWPSIMPPWLSLPIDKVWTSEPLRVVSFRVGPRFRSDHRPFVAEIEIPSSGPEQAPNNARSGEPSEPLAR